MRSKKGLNETVLQLNCLRKESKYKTLFQANAVPNIKPIMRDLAMSVALHIYAA